ncbi:MAG: flagellar basal body P-ring formation protein FlgA [bacterium]|nr:flagellar basal body P-ring formation protein FlgA [bacterium]
MRKLSLIFLCLLAACLLAAETSLVLKNSAVVSDGIVRIKDIAVMDAATRGQIGNLVVAVAPEMGIKSSIGKQEILEKLVGNGYHSPNIKGPNRVTIQRKGNTVKPTFFKDIIHNYIIKNSKWKDGLQVNIVSSKTMIIPEEGVRWKLTPANGQDFFGNILFKVTAFSKATNEEILSNWVVAKLKIRKNVAISNRVIQKNEILRAEDLRWEMREITVFTKDALLTSQEIVGSSAGRLIRPNTVITSRVMAKHFLVKRGATALLVAHLHNVKATSRVRVLANGGPGDLVRVMNPVSKKIISARVTGKDRLEVTVE